MKENNNALVLILLMAMFCYSAIINASLFFSILIGFVFTLILILVIELNDDDIIKNALLDNKDITPELFEKIKQIFLMGIGIFVLLTTIIYNLIITYK